jgi:excisionase family DNA binding protein
VERLAVSVAEACAMIGIGRTKLYELIRDGRLKRVKVGRRTLLSVASIEALIATAS